MLNATEIAAMQTAVTLTFNATITLSRPGVRGAAETTILTGQRCHLRWPTEQERVMAAGAEVPVYLRDLPDVAYHLGDVVTLTALDGHAVLPPITKYRVGLVEQIPYPLPMTRVQLTGEGSYQ